VAEIAPMLGAILGISRTPKGQDKKRSKKSKGEKSVTEQGQQHGELASYKEPTEKQRVKEDTKRTMRNATDSWVSGHMTTAEHTAVHARAKHVLLARPVREFKGKSGERKMRGLR